MADYCKELPTNSRIVCEIFVDDIEKTIKMVEYGRIKDALLYIQEANRMFTRLFEVYKKEMDDKTYKELRDLSDDLLKTANKAILSKIKGD